MRSPVAIVQAQVEAYNRQDIDAFIASFHPEVEFINWPAQVLHRGHEAFRQRYSALWARSPKLQAKILNRTLMGRFVIDLELLVNHADGPRSPVLVIYETEGELIRRFWALSDDS
jgi:hypothetical protein